MDCFGGMLSFSVKGRLVAGRRLMNSVKLCSLAVSLGAVDTLIEHPATMTHAVVPKDVRERSGALDDLVRNSMGIEDVEDIIANLDQALERICGVWFPELSDFIALGDRSNIDSDKTLQIA